MPIKLSEAMSGNPHHPDSHLHRLWDLKRAVEHSTACCYVVIEGVSKSTVGGRERVELLKILLDLEEVGRDLRLSAEAPDFPTAEQVKDDWSGGPHR